MYGLLVCLFSWVVFKRYLPPSYDYYYYFFFVSFFWVKFNFYKKKRSETQLIIFLMTNEYYYGLYCYVSVRKVHMVLSGVWRSIGTLRLYIFNFHINTQINNDFWTKESIKRYWYFLVVDFRGSDIFILYVRSAVLYRKINWVGTISGL